MAMPSKTVSALRYGRRIARPTAIDQIAVGLECSATSAFQGEFRRIPEVAWTRQKRRE
jgi:hypothetical protein